MQKYAAWFPALLLAAFAALTAWIDQQMRPDETTRDGKARHDPDFIADNFSTIRIGADGKARYTLSARRMVHYPDDDTTVLDSPKFVNLINPDAPVTATSTRATVSGEGENIYLTENVRLVRAAHAGKSELTVETTYLHVIPDQNIAKTDQMVRIYDHNTLITSIGLELNNETRVLKLLSNVRGRIETPAPAD